MATKPKFPDTPSERDLGWLAGLIEGEGCFSCNQAGDGRWTRRLQVTSTDLDVLERCQSITGVGTICMQRAETERTKTCWTWRVYRWAEIERVIALVFLDLGRRRRDQAEFLLAHPPSRLGNAPKTYCKHGHVFTPENTRVDQAGRRWCRACNRQRNRDMYRRQHV